MVRQLEELQEAIKLARCQYRVQRTPANEAALQRLVDEADTLTFDIGFGIAPKKR